MSRILVKQAVVAALLLASAPSGRAVEEAECAQEAPDSHDADALRKALRHEFSEGISLLSARSHALTRAGRARGAQHCARLDNKDTHFTVDVAVGTPAQVFAVVADTGSNSLIVTSCVCTAHGYCGEENRCFTGSNKSNTFHSDPEQQELVLSFGSGQIQAAEAVDVVSVAGVTVNMTDGILLMTDQALDFGGPFEGILGLGPPLPVKETATAIGNSQTEDTASTEGIWEKIFGGKPAHRQSREAADHRPIIIGGSSAADEPLGFLEQGRVSRFSMCFNDGADGVLRLGTPKAATAHGAVGTQHWGLGLEGISVGDSTSRVEALPPRDEEGGASALKGPSTVATGPLCSRESMEEGQTTPCGAIPDSGTTQIVGPQAHVDALLEAICDGWPRCSENHSALVKAVEHAEEVIAKEYNTNPFQFKVHNKGEVLKMMLSDCAVWLEKGGLDELPPVHFHLAGDSSKQTVTIPARTWVVETVVEAPQPSFVHIGGVDVPVVSNSTSMRVQACSHSFGPMEYDTKANGPVWILGTPLFFNYVVGYDLDQRTVSLTTQEEEPCGTCDEKVGLVASRSGAASGRSRAPRRQLGSPRKPTIDVSGPL